MRKILGVASRQICRGAVCGARQRCREVRVSGTTVEASLSTAALRATLRQNDAPPRK